jgi:hypothetical protein
LVFLNGAICHCLDFGHDHDHGVSSEHESDEPAPHDCDCAVLADYLQPESASIDFQGLAALTGPAVELVERTDEVSLDGLSEVRPPGEHGPPRFVLHCALIC